jgi:CheY-like chemotaxis protein
LALYEEKHTKILLVDDEPDILEIVGYNLLEGYQIVTVNGKDAIVKAKKKNSRPYYYGCYDAGNGWNGSLRKYSENSE